MPALRTTTLEKPPAGFTSWGDLLEYVEDRDHADYRELTVGALAVVFEDGEDELEIFELAGEPCSCDQEDPRAIEGGHRCGSCAARDDVRQRRLDVETTASPAWQARANERR